jgi:hypothetical protein
MLTGYFLTTFEKVFGKMPSIRINKLKKTA